MDPMDRLRTSVAPVAVALVAALLAVACGSAGGSSSAPSASVLVVGGKVPFVPRIVSSESIVGPNRFVLGILDPSGTKTVGGPDLKVGLTFTPPAGASPAPATQAGSIPATFVWAIPDERGVYTVNVDFPTAGDWALDVSAQGKGMDGVAVDGTVGLPLQVTAKGYAIPLGGKAPSTKTPTLADVGGDPKKISTDTNPDPSFYATSVDTALATHEPFVLVFATPGFCRTAQCGPTLDGVKAVAKGEPGMTFINVEPYELTFTDGRLQPVLSADNQLRATATTNAWGILSEPWVYVVDGNGIVKGSFEAVVGADELKAAIATVR
jgi:hypothetical protein